MWLNNTTYRNKTVILIFWTGLMICLNSISVHIIQNILVYSLYIGGPIGNIIVLLVAWWPVYMIVVSINIIQVMIILVRDRKQRHTKSVVEDTNREDVQQEQESQTSGTSTGEN